MVRSDACSTPISSSTRTESALEVGSTIRASTSCANAASPSASNPSRAYTLVSTCHSSADRFPVITPVRLCSGTPATSSSSGS